MESKAPIEREIDEYAISIYGIPRKTKPFMIRDLFGQIGKLDQYKLIRPSYSKKVDFHAAKLSANHQELKGMINEKIYVMNESDSGSSDDEILSNLEFIQSKPLSVGSDENFAKSVDKIRRRFTSESYSKLYRQISRNFYEMTKEPNPEFTHEDIDKKLLAEFIKEDQEKERIQREIELQREKELLEENKVQNLIKENTILNNSKDDNYEDDLIENEVFDENESNTEGEIEEEDNHTNQIETETLKHSESQQFADFEPIDLNNQKNEPSTSLSSEKLNLENKQQPMTPIDCNNNNNNNNNQQNSIQTQYDPNKMMEIINFLYEKVKNSSNDPVFEETLSQKIESLKLDGKQTAANSNLNLTQPFESLSVDTNYGHNYSSYSAPVIKKSWRGSVKDLDKDEVSFLRKICDNRDRTLSLSPQQKTSSFLSPPINSAAEVPRHGFYNQQVISPIPQDQFESFYWQNRQRYLPTQNNSFLFNPNYSNQLNQSRSKFDPVANFHNLNNYFKRNPN